MSASTAVQSQQTALFLVEACACPQILGRILGYVAQQGRLVDALDAVRSCERLRIALRLSDIDAGRAEVLAAKMRMLVEVYSVGLSFGPL